MAGGTEWADGTGRSRRTPGPESRCPHRVGAVIVTGNRILAFSPNLRRNDPTTDFHHATFHAEEAALRRLRNPTATEIWIARVTRTDQPALARPCPRCQNALTTAGITQAHYTTNFGTTETLHLTTPHHTLLLPDRQRDPQLLPTQPRRTHRAYTP